MPHRPGVDDLAKILGRDLERIPIVKKEAHTREDGLVVADRRVRRAVLVAEPAQVATDELAERCLAVRLVLHRLPDDPGGLAERQARRPAIGVGSTQHWGRTGRPAPAPARAACRRRVRAGELDRPRSALRSHGLPPSQAARATYQITGQ